MWRQQFTAEERKRKIFSSQCLLTIYFPTSILSWHTFDTIYSSFSRRKKIIIILLLNESDFIQSIKVNKGNKIRRISKGRRSTLFQLLLSPWEIKRSEAKPTNEKTDLLSFIDI